MSGYQVGQLLIAPEFSLTGNPGLHIGIYTDQEKCILLSGSAWR